jgi:hypothetical protein
MSYRLPAPPPPAEQCLPGRDATANARGYCNHGFCQVAYA